MIVDVNAFTGHSTSYPTDGSVSAVRNSLCAVGVDRIFLSPLNAAWFPNPHRCNQEVYDASDDFDDIVPVPIIDPTVTTWRDELARAAEHPKVKAVKLLPAYSPYELSSADDLLNELAKAVLAAVIQTRLEDPRRQHPLAQVPDIPASEVAGVAERHPDLTVIIGGPRWAEIKALSDQLLALPNLYADVSQADGFDSLKLLVEMGLAPRLLFGSHAPIFIPWSAMARVVNDLNNVDAEAILGGNTERLLHME